ncbi:MAG: polysaccharide biosynthesis protein [Treponema sp.]|nr:MAG: polysaccharide biosynthesis protein [Treponema sp.]
MSRKENKKQNLIYIVGAGLAGTSIADEIQKKGILGKAVAFLDDDPKKIGKKINGLPVLGPIDEVANLIRINPADEALISIPTIKIERLREIYEVLKQSGFSTIKLLPALSQIVEGSAHLVQTREINPEDLLGRNPIAISLKKTLAYLKGKRVLITGAGGSIGSELSRQLFTGGAERVYLLGHGENSIYQINKELRILQEAGVGENAIIVPIIGDLTDRDYVRYIIKQLRCDIVFHAAAYKHVPLMEANPVAAISNNVFGTKNLLDACFEFNVKRFVLISTDKAVEPVCVYGVSKFLSEQLVLATAEKIKKEKPKGLDYMFVRFGNVLGSRGSIFPLWVEQVKNGGPVTVTDKKMSRYFMTITEACSLVLQTGGLGKNACSYLLDMGEPVSIYETAKQLIKYLGYEPEKEIEIKIIGLRKGERLEEPLWSKSEMPEKTDYSKILKLNKIENIKNTFSITGLNKLLNELYPICYLTQNEQLFRNKTKLLRILKKEFPDLKSDIK